MFFFCPALGDSVAGSDSVAESRALRWASHRGYATMIAAKL